MWLQNKPCLSYIDPEIPKFLYEMCFMDLLSMDVGAAMLVYFVVFFKMVRCHLEIVMLF